MPVLSGRGETGPDRRRSARVSRSDLRELRRPGRRPICPAQRPARVLQHVLRQGPSRNGEHAGDRVGRTYTPPMGVIIIREMVGRSPNSWSDAARRAVETAAKTVRNIQTVEVVKSTAEVRDGEIVEYRVELKIGFEYEA